MKRTRKLISLALALMLLAGLLPAAAARAATTDTCPSSLNGEHNWIVYENPATCTDTGYREYQCTYCYASRAGETLPALGHSWGEWVYRVEPTCTESGTRHHQCTRCWTNETETVPALGHAYSAAVTKQPTCTAAGVTTYTCSRCGESYTESTAALGHSYDGGTVTREATCTEPGVMTYACSRCGESFTESVPALGHDWQSVTTEPQGLTDGQTVVTCSRCGETETQIIPAAPGMFNLLRNIPPTFEEMGDMVVTLQPEGGMIPDGGVLPLTTAVEGGVPPYTYEWHREINLYLPEGMLQAAADRFVSTYNDNKAGFAADFLDAFGKQNGIEGTIVHPQTVSGGSIYSPGSAAYQAGLLPVTYDLGDRNLGVSESPEYHAAEPGTYYCVIRDSGGHWVSTADVEVARALHIVTQPKNTNIHDLQKVTLTCVAAGGTPFTYTGAPYIYAWYAEDGTALNWYDAAVEVDKPGTYYCVVQDDAGAVVTSGTAEVYEAPLLELTLEETDYTVEDVEHVDIPVGFTVTGGAPPYCCRWMRDSETLEVTNCWPGEDGTASETFTATSVGTFTVIVVDDMGETRTGTVTVDREHMVISTSGTIGSLETNDLFFYVSVQDGLAPYTYTVYREGEVYQQTEDDTRNVGFRISLPGSYVFHVEDARGDTDETAPVEIVGEARPIITRQPESVTLKYREDGEYSAVFSCEAVSPATWDDSVLEYEWEIYDNTIGWRYAGITFKRLPFSLVQPGTTCRCKVIDSTTGSYVYSNIVTAEVGVYVKDLAIDVRKDGYYLVGEIMGGVAPYTAVIHERRIVDQVPNENNTYDNVYSDVAFTADTFDSAVPFSRFLTKKITYDYFAKFNGSYLPQNTSYEYYIVVTDAVGTEYESEIVRNN